MSERTSLVILSQASKMLAEATTIQKAKELKDLALTAQDWARRKDMGEEAIQHCRTYALLAERRLGELLAATERADGGDAQRTRLHDVTESPPTLTELGVSKRESAEAQLLATLPQKDFEAVLSGKTTVAKARKEQKKKRHVQALDNAQATIAAEARQELAKVCDVRNCSMKELFAAGVKPDCVITDPPYPREFLSLYEELAEATREIPLVAVMCGQSYLPEILAAMCQHLTYRWTLAYLTPGGQAVQLWDRKVNTFWKPILIFGKAQDWLGDVCSSKPNDNDKRFHEWAQSVSGMTGLVERISKPGELVCDPFCGSGTTGVASLVLGRRFVGCDIDGECVRTTLLRCSLAISEG